MSAHRIPTAAFAVFEDNNDAFSYAETFFQDHPGKWLVVKADGLAAGKGVIICENIGQVKKALTSIMLKRKFGDAGKSIVIEECLVGEEISVMVMCDGEDALLMLPSQDHKRIGKGDSDWCQGSEKLLEPIMCSKE